MGFKFYAPAKEKLLEEKAVATQKLEELNEEENLIRLSLPYILELSGKFGERLEENEQFRKISHIRYEILYSILEKIAADKEAYKETILQIERKIGYLERTGKALANALTESIKKSEDLYTQLHGEVSTLRKIVSLHIKSNYENSSELYDDEDETV